MHTNRSYSPQIVPTLHKLLLLYTNCSYSTQIVPTLLASQREGAIPNCLVPPSKHDCVSHLRFWCEWRAVLWLTVNAHS